MTGSCPEIAIDRTVLRPDRSAFSHIPETVGVCAHRIHSVEESHPLRRGDLHLANTEVVRHRTNRHARGRRLLLYRGIWIGLHRFLNIRQRRQARLLRLIHVVIERNDPRRCILRSCDGDSAESHNFRRLDWAGGNPGDRVGQEVDGKESARGVDRDTGGTSLGKRDDLRLASRSNHRDVVCAVVGRVAIPGRVQVIPIGRLPVLPRIVDFPLGVILETLELFQFAV